MCLGVKIKENPSVYNATNIFFFNIFFYADSENTTIQYFYDNTFDYSYINYTYDIDVI